MRDALTAIFGNKGLESGGAVSMIDFHNILQQHFVLFSYALAKW
jgi:hypothetical protein